MFTALRGRFRTGSTTADAPTTGSHRGTSAQATADATARAHAQARIETLDSYLGSLTEQDRAEYIAAAQDLEDAMNETGTEDFRACSRGGRPPGGGSVPDGIRSLQELRGTRSHDPPPRAGRTRRKSPLRTQARLLRRHAPELGSGDGTDPDPAGQQKP